MKNQNVILGSIIGGAIGDALGYPIEFMNEEEIYRRYGNKGIREFELADGKALISDDTQMTLFTVNGLLLAETRSCMRGLMPDYTLCIAKCYEDWLTTQVRSQNIDYKKESFNCSWLINEKRLYASREPGRTCISEIANGCKGSLTNKINSSKGCGGIMRVAPIGLFFNSITDNVPMIGAEVAALTHTHPLGYIPAYILVDILQYIHHGNADLESIVRDSLLHMSNAFTSLVDRKYIEKVKQLIRQSIELAHSDMDDIKAIHQLGEGWVAEETLAIAIYCSLKHIDSFEEAIIASVNHKGDSDSTGAVTGNIMGAYLGYDAIPKEYIEHLECLDIIEEIANDLCVEEIPVSEYDNNYETVIQRNWMRKYVDMTFSLESKEK